MRVLRLLLLFVLGAGVSAYGSQPDLPHEYGPAYLVYAGPYSSSPASALGHLFLVLQQREDDPLPLWDVVTFVAQTNDAGPLRFMITGITGGFLGRYTEAKFHNQVRDYEVLEDRDLWLLQLDLTQDQRRALNQHISELSSSFYPYFFFTKNCAYYLQEVLSHVMNAVPAPSGPTSPIGVMELISNIGAVKACYFRPSISRRLQTELRTVSSMSLEKIHGQDWRDLASDHKWIAGLTPSERGFVQQYVYYKSLNATAPPDSGSMRGMELMRVLNASDTEHVGAVAGKVNLGEARSFPDFHSYTKFSMSTETGGDGNVRIGVGIRPAIHDLEDPWVGFRRINTLQMLSVDLSRSTQDWDVRLDRLVIYSQRALTPVSFVVDDPSWCLELQAERKGVFGSNKLNWVTRGGYGRTWEPMSDSYFYALLSGAVIWAADESIAVAPGVIAGAAFVGSRTWRAGIESTFEASLFSGSQRVSAADLWIRRDLGKSLGATAFISYGDEDPRYGVRFSMYP